MIPWNSVQTPKDAAALPAHAAAFTRRLRRRGARAAGSRQSGLVIREIGYFLHILGMTNFVLRIQDKNRPAFDSQILNQSSVICAERCIFVVGKHLYFVHTERSAPPLLGKRQ